MHILNSLKIKGKFSIYHEKRKEKSNNNTHSSVLKVTSAQRIYMYSVNTIYYVMMKANRISVLKLNLWVQSSIKHATTWYIIRESSYTQMTHRSMKLILSIKFIEMIYYNVHIKEKPNLTFWIRYKRITLHCRNAMLNDK